MSCTRRSRVVCARPGADYDVVTVASSRPSTDPFYNRRLAKYPPGRVRRSTKGPLTCGFIRLGAAAAPLFHELPVSTTVVASSRSSTDPFYHRRLAKPPPGRVRRRSKGPLSCGFILLGAASAPLFHVVPVSTTVVASARLPSATDPKGHPMTTQENSTHGSYVVKGESFDRDMNYIDDRITRDGRDGWPVEAGRYRLIAARACPWANRTLISRRLLGLEEVLSVGMPGPTHDKRSWTFDLDEGGVDPV